MVQASTKVTIERELQSLAVIFKSEVSKTMQDTALVTIEH